MFGFIVEPFEEAAGVVGEGIVRTSDAIIAVRDADAVQKEGERLEKKKRELNVTYSRLRTVIQAAEENANRVLEPRRTQAIQVLNQTSEYLKADGVKEYKTKELFEHAFDNFLYRANYGWSLKYLIDLPFSGEIGFGHDGSRWLNDLLTSACDMSGNSLPGKITMAHLMGKGPAKQAQLAADVSCAKMDEAIVQMEHTVQIFNEVVPRRVNQLDTALNGMISALQLQLNKCKLKDLPTTKLLTYQRDLFVLAKDLGEILQEKAYPNSKWL